MKIFLVTTILIAIMLIGAGCSNYISEQEKCEKAGGIFFDGLFSNDCVFPPN